MLAEAMIRLSHRLIRNYPPEGRAYFAGRSWEGERYEAASLVGPEIRINKKRIADLVRQYGKDAERVLEFACGPGEYTEVAAGLCSAPEIVAVDISPSALENCERRVDDPRLKLILGDFWKDLGLGTADLVMSVQAIHHLGLVKSVLERMITFVSPGGVLIGNVWILDNYHEYQRDVHGPVRHLARSSLFLANAIAMRATGGKVRWGSYRSQLLYAAQFEKILQDVAPEILDLSTTRYMASFAIRC